MVIYVHVLWDCGILYSEDESVYCVSLGRLRELLEIKSEFHSRVVYSRHEIAATELMGIHVLELLTQLEIPIKLERECILEHLLPDVYVPRLIWTAANGVLDWLAELINNGADLEIRDSYGQTALMMAADFGQIDAVEMLVKAGASVDSKDCDGSTPLMFAAQKGRTQVAQMLLDAGADVHAVGTHGFTAIAVAERFGHKDIIEMIRATRGRGRSDSGCS